MPRHSRHWSMNVQHEFRRPDGHRSLTPWRHCAVAEGYRRSLTDSLSPTVPWLHPPARAFCGSAFGDMWACGRPEPGDRSDRMAPLRHSASCARSTSASEVPMPKQGRSGGIRSIRVRRVRSLRPSGRPQSRGLPHIEAGVRNRQRGWRQTGDEAEQRIRGSFSNQWLTVAAFYENLASISCTIGR